MTRRHRMTTSKVAATILLTLVVLTACQDDPTAGPERGSDALDLAVLPIQRPEADLVAAPLFKATLKVTPTGALRVQATLVVTSTQVAPNTSILITAPEFTFAKSSRDYPRNPTETLVAGLRFGAALIPTSSWRRTVELEAPEPGYYRILASIKDTTVLIAQPRGFVQTVEHVEQWFWIDEAGLRVTGSHNLDELPDTVVKRAGPRVIQIRNPRSAPQGPNLGPTIRPALWTGPSEVPGEVRYASTLTQWPSANARLVWFDQDAAVWRGIGTEGQVDVWDNYEARYIATFSVWTNSDGTFEMGCPPSEFERWDYTFFAPWNSGFSITPNTLHARNVIAAWDVEAFSCVGGDYTANAYTMEVHTNFATLIPASNSFFAHTRPSVKVRVDNGASNSLYSPGSDQITIKSGGSADHVWGPWGVFVATHEWGHALHEKGLGGNVASGSCPSPHYLNG
ncbi:hypothetical protein, partial [Microbacterium sp.]|uniref:hypothetical protein n=1 Tax=Microbacterium sp. TaxID=51671 RepID=UPI00273769C7